MRESTIFYKSFRDALKQFPDADRLKLYDSIFDYIFDGIEPKLEGMTFMAFTLMRSIKNYENGSKGGRPKANNNRNETQKEPKENRNETESITYKDKDIDKDQNKDKNQDKDSGLPAFVADDADAFFPDLLWQLKIHHDTKCPIELREEIAKKKNGYIMLVQKIPLWNEKKKYLNIPDEQIQKLLVEWLSFNSKNKAEVSWKNYAEMAQHAFNFIDKKIKNQNNGQNSQHAIAPASTEQNRPADKSWFGKL